MDIQLMPSLHIIFDPNDKIMPIPDAHAKAMGFEACKMPIPANLGSVDIYNVAKKLAELMLEQLLRAEKK